MHLQIWNQLMTIKIISWIKLRCMNKALQSKQNLRKISHKKKDRNKKRVKWLKIEICNSKSVSIQKYSHQQHIVPDQWTDSRTVQRTFHAWPRHTSTRTSLGPNKYGGATTITIIVTTIIKACSAADISILPTGQVSTQMRTFSTQMEQSTLTNRFKARLVPVT